MIPDLAGLDVFEAGGQLVDGVDVHASFVGEGGPAHERGTGVMREVGQLIHEAGKLGEFFQVAGG